MGIWKDRWLPTSDSFRVVSPKPPQAESEPVTDLIDRDRGCWDATKIRNIFLPHEAQVILAFPISPGLPRDSLIWAWTPRGKFTVNSTYKVAPTLLREAHHNSEWGECSNTAGK